MSKVIWPAEIVSVQQVRQTLAELEMLKGWLKDYNRSARIGAITAAPRPALSADTLLLTGRVDPAKLSVDQVTSLIQNVEKNLAQSLIVHLTLSVLPSLPARRDLANWFRNNLSSEILLTFAADTSLAGGMVVRTKNHLYNFSFSKLLWERRQMIPRLVNGR